MTRITRIRTDLNKILQICLDPSNPCHPRLNLRLPTIHHDLRHSSSAVKSSFTHIHFGFRFGASTSSLSRSSALDQSSANGPIQRSYIRRIGTGFNEFSRFRPSFFVLMSDAPRSTSMCFITACRVISGNASTISVVVLGPSRNRSRIVRRVGSESAFQMMSLSLSKNSKLGTKINRG